MACLSQLSYLGDVQTASQSASRPPPPWPGPAGQQHHQLPGAGASGVPAVPQESPRRLGHHRRHCNKSPVCACPFLGRAEFAPQLSGSLPVSSPAVQQDVVPRVGTEGCQWKQCTGALCSAQAAAQPREGKEDRFWREKHLWPLPRAPWGDRALPDHVPQPDGLDSLCQELPRLGIVHASSSGSYRHAGNASLPIPVLEPRSCTREEGSRGGRFAPLRCCGHPLE